MADETTAVQAPAEEPEKPIPQNIRNLHIKAQGSLERNPDLAIDLLLRCVTACPWFLQARTDLRKAEIGRYLLKHNGKVAVSPLAAATAFFPKMKVAGLVKKQKFAEALVECEKLLLNDPLNIHFVKLFAETAIAAGRSPAGLMTMELAKEHIPANDVDATLVLGQLYFQTKNYPKAVECFDIVHRARPTDAAIGKMLKDGDFRKAFQDKKMVEELDAANKSVKTADDAQKIIAETLRKIEKEPKNVNYYLALVNLYLQQKQYDEALAAIDKCRAVVGQDPQLDLRYAAVKTEKYDTDIAALREAGQNEQADALQAERDQYVFDDIADRVQRYPNDQHLRFQLGEQYWKYRDRDPGLVDEALQQFQISQRSPKDRVASLYLMAHCFVEKGMLDMAVEQLKSSLELLPSMDKQKMDVYYMLGELYEKEGRLDDASKYFKEIYRADVTYKDIADRVQRIYAAQKEKEQGHA